MSIETLKESDLTIGKQLGGGRWGDVISKVHECYLSSNDTMKFAIQFIKIEDKSKLKDAIVKGILLMERLVNMNVVQLYGLVLVITVSI